jgi:DNA polymerase
MALRRRGARCGGGHARRAVRGAGRASPRQHAGRARHDPQPQCRPPNNRTPEAAEADACRPYLERQIALLQPRIIVALGKSAASLLLGGDASIASLRGRAHAYRGVPLVVTYHPAYLLRTPTDKGKAWEDLLLARQTVAAGAGADPAGAPSVA